MDRARRDLEMVRDRLEMGQIGGSIESLDGAIQELPFVANDVMDAVNDQN